jgi:hypothetical protein
MLSSGMLDPGQMSADVTSAESLGEFPQTPLVVGLVELLAHLTGEPLSLPAAQERTNAVNDRCHGGFPSSILRPVL